MEWWKPRIFFYCQYGVGIGHLQRSLALMEAMRGFDVTFASGGQMYEGARLPAWVRLLQLPSLKMTDDYRSVVSSGGGMGTREVEDLRREVLVNGLEEARPDVVMTELFPFGRMGFLGELVPMLERAARLDPKPLMVCSVRDILVRGRKYFEKNVLYFLNRYYDYILMHADPRLTVLGETFRNTALIRPRLYYTGMVAAPKDGAEVRRAQARALARRREGEELVVVSAGGGRAGWNVLENALLAKPRLDKVLPHRMLVLTGPHLPQSDFDELENAARGLRGAQVVRFASEFAELLHGTALSISQSGYNTSANVLAAGTPALVIPYQDYGQTEQFERAAKLEERGFMRSLSEARLTPESLTRAAAEALQPRFRRGTPALEGASVTAALLAAMVEEHRRHKGDRRVRPWRPSRFAHSYPPAVPAREPG